MPDEQKIRQTELDWQTCLEANKVIWRYRGYGPHAIHSLSDRHSNFYFNSDILSTKAALLEDVCKALFGLVKGTVKPDWIVTYPPFGLSIGYCLAELFDVRLAYINSLKDDRFQFDLQKQESALFCADDLYSGKSFRQVARAVKKRGVQLLEPLLVVGNFSGRYDFDGHQITALFQREIDTWHADQCPLCAAGSKAIYARPQWQELSDQREPAD
jgi:orotate phosphoribosyltransferase